MKLVDNYKLETLLGTGEFGKVYKSVDTNTGLYYAIKSVNKSFFVTHPKLKEFTANEMHSLTKINNPNVIKFIELIKTENNYYFVYEYCNGGTLEDLILAHGYLTEEMSRKVLKQIINGLDALNKNFILHRDLKPQNIFFHNGEVKIGDFGFCKQLRGRGDMAKTMLGSPIYMAPEILTGQNYGLKADIWSLGCIYFEMLCGYCPFEGKDIREIIDLINQYRITFREGVRISDEVKFLIYRMLQIDSIKRIEWDDLFTEVNGRRLVLNFDSTSPSSRPPNTSQIISSAQKNNFNFEQFYSSNDREIKSMNSIGSQNDFSVSQTQNSPKVFLYPGISNLNIQTKNENPSFSSNISITSPLQKILTNDYYKISSSIDNSPIMMNTNFLNERANFSSPSYNLNPSSQTNFGSYETNSVYSTRKDNNDRYLHNVLNLNSNQVITNDVHNVLPQSTFMMSSYIPTSLNKGSHDVLKMESTPELNRTALFFKNSSAKDLIKKDVFPNEYQKEQSYESTKHASPTIKNDTVKEVIILNKSDFARYNALVDVETPKNNGKPDYNSPKSLFFLSSQKKKFNSNPLENDHFTFKIKNFLNTSDEFFQFINFERQKINYLSRVVTEMRNIRLSSNIQNEIFYILFEKFVFLKALKLKQGMIDKISVEISLKTPKVTDYILTKAFSNLQVVLNFDLDEILNLYETQKKELAIMIPLTEENQKAFDDDYFDWREFVRAQIVFSERFLYYLDNRTDGLAKLCFILLIKIDNALNMGAFESLNESSFIRDGNYNSQDNLNIEDLKSIATRRIQVARMFCDTFKNLNL